MYSSKIYTFMNLYFRIVISIYYFDAQIAYCKP